jgi:ferredoxin-NADP reductase
MKCYIIPILFSISTKQNKINEPTIIVLNSQYVMIKLTIKNKKKILNRNYSIFRVKTEETLQKIAFFH